MEIRGIHQSEGDAVGDLWDHMCREGKDGAPLTEQGRRNLARMLGMSAWHRDAFCLVAVNGVEVVGFVNGRTSIGAGLLPGVLGEIDSLYVMPEERDKGISHALAEAAVKQLRDQGARTIRYLSCADADEDHRFWQGLGFEPDMVSLSAYWDE
jgi:GNAT superfamily N-acetyltransferase